MACGSITSRNCRRRDPESKAGHDSFQWLLLAETTQKREWAGMVMPHSLQ